MEHYQVIVIGAGQGGLAAGYHLQQQGYKYLIAEQSDQVGNAWFNRFDGLELFTPNNLNTMPGFSVPQSKGDLQTKQEFFQYLQDYKNHFKLNVKFAHQVTDIIKQQNTFIVHFANGHTYSADKVVIANGAFAKPKVGDSATVNSQVFHYSVDSVPIDDINNKRVLVIGDGASGRQIAKLLADYNDVYLASGQKRNLFSPTIMGFNTFNLLHRLGILFANKKTRLAKWLKKRDPFPNTGIDDRTLSKNGIRLMPRFINLDDKANATFINQQKATVDVVVWAIGYQNDHSFLKSLIGEQELQLNYGRTQINGLYTLSKPWQSSRASGLIAGLDHDMKLILGYLKED